MVLVGFVVGFWLVLVGFQLDPGSALEDLKWTLARFWPVVDDFLQLMFRTFSLGPFGLECICN